jgi:hypothetical protein
MDLPSTLASVTHTLRSDAAIQAGTWILFIIVVLDRLFRGYWTTRTKFFAITAAGGLFVLWSRGKLNSPVVEAYGEKLGEL